MTNMTRDLVIVGCGGFGREVADVVDAINRISSEWNLLGFADDSPSSADVDRVRDLHLQVFGTIDQVLDSQPSANYVVGIGDGLARKRIAERFDAKGWNAPLLAHPSSNVGARATIGGGSVLCAGATITTNVVMGRHVHLNLNSTVGHDSIVGNFVTVNPLVAISGNCRIEDAANLGTHSSLLPGITVGAAGVVGAAACVIKDVAAGAVVKGVPAR